MNIFLKKKMITVLFLLYSFIAVQAQNISVAQKHSSGNLIKIDLYEAYKNAQTYPLSTIAKSIEYLPLETNEDCLLNSSFINDITITSKDIIISVYEDKCYHFSRQGKFLNVIGSIGKGPKEFTKLRSSVVDTINRWVYTVDWDKLMKYDFEGNFLEKYKVEKNSLGMLNVMLQSGQILMGNGSYQYVKAGERYSGYVFSDKNKNHISKIVCEKKDKIPFCVCYPSMYNFKNKTYFSDYWCDTIYKVKNPNTLEAYAVLNKGNFEYRSTEDKSMKGGKNTGESNIIGVSRMTESQRFIFVVSDKGTYVFDKKENKTLCANWIEKPNIWVNFENDITSIPFRILNNAPNTIQDGKLISFSDAYQFFEDGIDTTNPKVKKLLQKLQPDDNPVLVLVKLKE